MSRSPNGSKSECASQPRIEATSQMKEPSLSGRMLYQLMNQKYANLHPILRLPRLERMPLTNVRCVRTSSIMLRVNVVPSFQVSETGMISNDGFTLGHGVWNYDSFGRNENAFAPSSKIPVSGSSTVFAERASL